MFKRFKQVRLLLSGHILDVSCVRQSHAWGCPFFKIFSNFVHFYSTFQIFCPCMPLLSRISPVYVCYSAVVSEMKVKTSKNLSKNKMHTASYKYQAFMQLFRNHMISFDPTIKLGQNLGKIVVCQYFYKLSIKIFNLNSSYYIFEICWFSAEALKVCMMEIIFLWDLPQCLLSLCYFFTVAITLYCSLQ